MKLSSSIYHLKRQAKQLSRIESIPLHEALDRIAAKEGFGAWSLLAVKASALTPAEQLFAHLTPGDLVLLGARPGHGKTLMSFRLLVEAIKSGRRAAFFTLEYTQRDTNQCLRAIGVERANLGELFEFDNSDAISADYIIRRLSSAARGTVAVIDYLQLLDQRRENPDLLGQVRALEVFARNRGLIFIFISQIDRSYNPLTKPYPSLEDVRLPNPLDLKLFTKTCFLNRGEVQFRSASSSAPPRGS